MNHTPTPWHAGQGNGEGCIFADGEGRMRLEIGGTTLYPIASVIDFEGERDANIAFIVKAVNSHEALLAALQALKDQYTHVANCCDMCWRDWPDSYDVDAVIAKATQP